MLRHIVRLCYTVSCTIALMVAPVCLAQQQSSATAGAQQTPASSVPTSAPTPAAAAIHSYPDSPKGLEDLINEMLKLQKKGDAKALAPYVDSLVLPNAGTWFRATFGDEIGTQLADSYDRTRMNLPLAFPDILGQLNSKHLANAHAIVFTDSCNPDATEDEYQVLINRTKAQQPLYDVRLVSQSEGARLAYFAYVDGAFRYISNFQLNTPPDLAPVRAEPSGTPETKTAKGILIRGKVIKSVPPEYPMEARLQGIRGKVLLHAIIGKNGQLCSLHLIQGDPLLAAAAFQAVRQWRYAPYLLNGTPVSVDTTITVTFNLEN